MTIECPECGETVEDQNTVTSPDGVKVCKSCKPSCWKCWDTGGYCVSYGPNMRANMKCDQCSAGEDDY